MAEKSTVAPAERLVSLDAYRGFVMLAMASSGFRLASACTRPEVVGLYDKTGAQTAWRWLCAQLAFHTEHVPWAGCSFWDLIQPSFMFMVGVALPFSMASRESLGQSGFMQFLHVLKRSAVLILLGIFLTSNGQLHTKVYFTNVLTQIGMGYPFVWLLLRRGTAVQLTIAAAILGGYWYAFFQHPLPGPGFNPAAVGLPPDWPAYHGLAAHWNKGTNWAAAMDLKWLNLFAHYDKSGALQPFKFNEGGYQTLNFVPSIVTMIFGLMAGRVLRSPLSATQRTWRLIWTGALCLVLGLALDPRLIGPFPIDWTLCPVVKRIWTPSWTLFSTGWTLWMLAAFYWIIDVKGWKWWAFPLTVVGMNSIAMYVGAQLLKPWISQTLKTHFGQDLYAAIGEKIFRVNCGPVVEQALILFVLWLMCFWMYRRKIFVRV